jgi:hypothetical protein
VAVAVCGVAEATCAKLMFVDAGVTVNVTVTLC